MFNGNGPYVFYRTSNIYTFSRNPLPQKNSYLHIFIPWDGDIVHNLMFQMKAIINERQSCFAPMMNVQLDNASLTSEQLKTLREQLAKNVETHLIMSNLDSIHIFKIKNVFQASEVSSEQLVSTPDCFVNKEKFEYWFELDDMYVHRANHTGLKNDILDELRNLIEEEQNQNIFTPIQKLSISNIKENQKLKAEALKWIELNRNLTYDYFIRSCELEENIYQCSWRDLSRRTQHCLIMTEQLRHKGILYQDKEKLIYFKESFEGYLSALINELNEVYIRPLVSAYHQYASLREVWESLQTGLINPELKEILNNLFHSDDQISSVETFLVYIKNAKTCLFSMKHRYERKIGKEEYLLLENFLTKQENLIESFICKKLDQKLKGILEIKNWLEHVISNIDDLSLNEVKDYALKLTHLLSIMTSASYEDNLFFRLIEEKTLRAIMRKSFEDEVKELNRFQFNKAA